MTWLLGYQGDVPHRGATLRGGQGGRGVMGGSWVLISGVVGAMNKIITKYTLNGPTHNPPQKYTLSSKSRHRELQRSDTQWSTALVAVVSDIYAPKTCQDHSDRETGKPTNYLTERSSA